jgi:hypothetical protein
MKSEKSVRLSVLAIAKGDTTVLNNEPSGFESMGANGPTWRRNVDKLCN